MSLEFQKMWKHKKSNITSVSDSAHWFRHVWHGVLGTWIEWVSAVWSHGENYHPMQGHAGPPPFVFKGGSTMVNRPIYTDVLKQYSISKGSTKRVMFSCQIDKIVNAPTGCYVSPQEEMVKTVKCDFDGDWLSRFGWLKCWSEGLLCYWNVGFGMDRANLWMHSGNWVKKFDQGDERLPILAPQDVCRVEGCTPCLYFMIQRGCAGSTCGWCHLRHDPRNESFGFMWSV